ncbi:NADPH-dependent FMN reductase [Paenibacillus glycanilyticus]|uniref:NAD(P)H-dependent FMN reductase n=1 Tax=Paenibacillus glycanilyticus TaxID=126569 RepID=A0ABQ6GBK1_9BACL|nr:NAD(P)H-dependent oxidoreductase [Paenibacillus glycanilyticus]GLX67890.1 NAD(P)H-dependent FMN reductase [Paenibacillus glycanilyticus]
MAHIVGLTGSLRKASLNKSLLKNAALFLPESYTYTYADLSDLPLYNQDLEENLPEEVKQFAELCKSADGFLISTPEYNGMITGVLKNALDWVSRKNIGAPLATKPVAVMGATPGPGGTVRAQMNLRQLIFALDMDPVNRPELKLSHATMKFDDDGRITDFATLQVLEQLMGKFVDKVERSKE